MSHYPLKFKTLEQTCGACPSQWEGKAETGEEIYIRYRWGVLRLDVNNTTVYQEAIGASMDGLIDEGLMLNRLRGFICRT